jgi:hypothetical protein
MPEFWGRGGEEGCDILALPFWFRTPPAINLLCCWCHVREEIMGKEEKDVAVVAPVKQSIVPLASF